MGILKGGRICPITIAIFIQLNLFGAKLLQYWFDLFDGTLQVFRLNCNICTEHFAIKERQQVQP